MDTKQIVVTVSVAVVGWLVVALGWAVSHFLALRQAVKTERRKSRVEFLTKTYKRIVELRVFAADKGPKDIATFLCDISADIELQGTYLQIELVAKAIENLRHNGSLLGLDELAQSLLDDLRGNMDLAEVKRHASTFGYSEKAGNLLGE
jgi:hypothetical protein